MQVKVIKKGKINTQEEQQPAVFQPAGNTKKKVERKVESNILNWISDLREKKSLEFAQTQMLLSSIR